MRISFVIIIKTRQKSQIATGGARTSTLSFHLFRHCSLEDVASIVLRKGVAALVVGSIVGVLNIGLAQHLACLRWAMMCRIKGLVCTGKNHESKCARIQQDGATYEE